MAMTATDAILSQLEERAKDWEFPVLDNDNWVFVGGRLRGFQSGHDWGLVFELLIYQIPAQGFWAQYYAYGPLIDEPDGNKGVLSVLDEVAEAPLWDDDSNWIQTSVRRVLMRGRPVTVVCGPSPHVETEQLNIPECHDESSFLLGVFRELGIDQLIPEDKLFEVLPNLRGCDERVRLDDWDHPSLLDGQTPAESLAVTSTIRLLTGEDDLMTYEGQGANANWQTWCERPK